MGANPVRSSDKRLYREFHFRNYGNCQEYVKKLNKTDDLKWKVSWDKAELGKLKQAYSMDYSGKFKPKAIVELSLGKEYSRKLIVHKVGPKWLEIYLVRGKSIYGIEVYEKVDMLIGVPPGGGKATY